MLLSRNPIVKHIGMPKDLYGHNLPVSKHYPVRSETSPSGRPSGVSGPNCTSSRKLEPLTMLYEAKLMAESSAKVNKHLDLMIAQPQHFLVNHNPQGKRDSRVLPNHI